MGRTLSNRKEPASIDPPRAERRARGRRAFLQLAIVGGAAMFVVAAVYLGRLLVALLEVVYP